MNRISTITGNPKGYVYNSLPPVLNFHPFRIEVSEIQEVTRLFDDFAYPAIHDALPEMAAIAVYLKTKHICSLPEVTNYLFLAEEQDFIQEVTGWSPQLLFLRIFALRNMIDESLKPLENYS